MPLGILRTVVPAAPDAWITALTDYGTLSFGDVASAAIRYAREGFAVFEYMATMIKEYEDGYRSWPSNAAIFLPGGQVPKVGDRFLQTDLANTLQYMNKYFAPGYRRTACQAELESTLSQLAIVLGDSNEIKISGKAYTAPERALFSSFRLGGTTTICHGDLNSNNVIVPLRGRGITFIDFQDTGRGHVFEDFVALESSVRLYFKVDATARLTLDQLIDAEKALLESPTKGRSPTPSPLPYESLVQRIRESARAVFPDVEDIEYVYALAAFHYRLIRIKELSLPQKTRLLGCMFASIDKLKVENALD